MLKSLFFVCGFCLAGVAVSAPADSSRKINPINYITLGYGYNFTGGDLIKRYGTFSAFNAGFVHKTGRNYTMGVEGSLFFGAKVKENDMFAYMTGPSSGLIDANGNVAIIRLYMRGFSTSFSVGKLFTFNPRSPNTGFLVHASVGFIQHKIRFIYSKDILPQLDGGYYKGYDRLSNGLLLKQFVGYQHFSKKFGGHFFAGLEFSQGYTQNRRSWNYDDRAADTKKRLDLVTSIKAGFIIPLGNSHHNEEEFFQ